ncbi:hypothetical protein ACR6C2_01010 [Streptomyces sp. INA 01156]
MDVIAGAPCCRCVTGRAGEPVLWQPAVRHGCLVVEGPLRPLTAASFLLNPCSPFRFPPGAFSAARLRRELRSIR